MKNQFFYSRKVQKPVQIEGQEIQYNEYRDSLNLDKVIRSFEHEDGTLIILMDDIHQRKQEVPIYNKKREFTGTKYEDVTMQSEITISKEDKERFYKLTNAE